MRDINRSTLTEQNMFTIGFGLTYMHLIFREYLGQSNRNRTWRCNMTAVDITSRVADEILTTHLRLIEDLTASPNGNNDDVLNECKQIVLHWVRGLPWGQLESIIKFCNLDTTVACTFDLRPNERVSYEDLFYVLVSDVIINRMYELAPQILEQLLTA
jgi:hypothetical protein